MSSLDLNSISAPSVLCDLVKPFELLKIQLLHLLHERRGSKLCQVKHTGARELLRLRQAGD